MNAPLIRLRGIEKDYGEAAARVSVLRGINLDVAPGDFLAIMGASGSGKSTLLNLIGCLDRPSRGVYEFEGEDVARFSDDRLSTIRNERIGFIFQSFNLVAGLTVLENVEVPLYYGSVPPRTRAARCRELLAAVGLGHRLGHRPNQLSGGECQRVAIARALVNDPALLLADEPTGNLDSRTGQEVLDLIGRLHGEGHTVVMITHDAAIAARARRHIRMWDGMLEEAA